MSRDSNGSMTDQCEDEFQAEKNAVTSNGMSMQTTVTSNLLQMTKNSKMSPTYLNEQRGDKDGKGWRAESKPKHVAQL